MAIVTVTSLATLVFFDALLAGFRAAAGRDGRIAKAAYYRRALSRGMVAAFLILAGHATLAALLVATAPDPAATWQDLLRAGRDCVVIFGAFATLTIIAIAFWFAPNRELRLVPTLLVLGPLTLVRPLVIVTGLAFAAIRTPTPRVCAAALAAATTMLALERLLGREHADQWRSLLDPDTSTST
jgi:hypothetical protein